MGQPVLLEKTKNLKVINFLPTIIYPNGTRNYLKDSNKVNTPR